MYLLWTQNEETLKFTVRRRLCLHHPIISLQVFKKDFHDLFNGKMFVSERSSSISEVFNSGLVDRRRSRNVTDATCED